MNNEQLAQQVSAALLKAGHRPVQYDDALCVREAGFTATPALHRGGGVWVAHWLPTLDEADADPLQRARRQVVNDAVGHYMHTLKTVGVFEVTRVPGAGGYPYVGVRQLGAGV